MPVGYAPNSFGELMAKRDAISPGVGSAFKSLLCYGLCVCFVCLFVLKLSEEDLPGGPLVRTPSTARGMGSIPDWGTRILHAT